jgi:hypothetical protein
MAQIKAVTVRVAKTNIVIGLSLRQRLPHPLTDGDCRHETRHDLKQFTPDDRHHPICARTHRSAGEQPAPHIWRQWLPASQSPPRRVGDRRSEAEPVIGYWSRCFIGCEDIPLIP